MRLYARRFTVQERLGEQIADTLVELVAPRGVAVHLEAAHLCTQMRGVAEHGSRTVTTFWRGLYDEDAELRAEFLDEVRQPRLTPLQVLDEQPGLPELDLPEELRRLYGGGLGFGAPSVFANLVQTIDGVVSIPDARPLERRDRRRERGGPVRDGAPAGLRGRRARRLEDDARLAEGHLAPRARLPARGRGVRRAAAPAGASRAAGGGLRDGGRLASTPTHPVFEEGAIVLTTEAAAVGLRASVPAATEVVAVNGGDRVDLQLGLDRLRERGHSLILSEAGPDALRRRWSLRDSSTSCS